MKSAIKILSLWSLLAILLSAQTPVFTLGTITGNEGDSVNVPITVTNLDNIGAITLKIQFAPAVLQWGRAINWNPAFPSTGLAGVASGVVTVAWDNTSPLILATGKLLDLQFKYLGGTSSLNFITAQCEIADVNGEIIAVQYVNGQISPAVAINPPPAPVLLSPANNSVNLETSNVLSWTAVSGADYYKVEVSTSSAFTSLFLVDSLITGTSKTVSGLSNNTQYYWRVSAKNAGGSGPYSDVWNFTTKSIPAGPAISIGNVTATAGDTVLIPVYGSSLSNIGAITLKINYNATHLLWNSVTNWNAAFPSSGLGGALNGVVTIAWDNTVPLNLTSGKLFDLKFIYNGGTSNITFNTQLSEIADVNGEIINVSYVNGSISPAVAIVPVAPILSAPANNSSSVPLNQILTWNSVTGAETYQLQVATDVNFTTVVKDTILSGISKQMWGLLNSTKYYWRVRAGNVGGTGSWSEVWNFTTIIAAPGQVTLSSPANNATNQALNVNLNWNALSGAETYQLQVSTDANFTTVVKDTTFGGTSKQMWGLLNSTKYYWRVRASNVGGTGSWSEMWNFTTIIAAPGQVVLSSPANNAVNQALNTSLTWSALTGAETYQLQVSTDENFTTIVKDTTFGSTSKQMWGLLNSTKYYWRVRANNVGGTGSWSEIWNFTTIIAAPGSVTLNTPANNAVNQPLNVILNWNALNGAETYQLQVASDVNFTTIVKDTTLSGTSKQMWNLTNLTKYYWRVKASNVGGSSNWSEVWNLTTIIAAPGQVTLTSPANNAINQALNVTLNWSTLSGAETYQLQVASDANFTTIVKDTALAGTSKQMWGLVNSTKYYWRVKASNVGGTGNWSEVWNFTTIIAAPGQVTMTSPANNSKGLLNPVTVNWNTSARAEKYILQVSTSNTFNTFVVNDSTQTDQTEVLPTLNNYTEYFWRVKSVNVGGQSDWSEVWNFKTLGNPYASTLYTPSNNSVNQPITGLVFKWSKAQERIETIQKYQFQLATDALFTIIVTNDSTLTDTIKTLNSLIYLTKYYWRVRAQNQTGWGDWSEVWNTTTIIEKPANFTLSAPANNSKGLLNPVTVSWNTSARAEKYILQVSTSSTFTSFVVNDSNQTDLTEVLPTLNNYTQYYWRVKSVNVGGQSDWSEVWNFKTLGNPYASTLYTPANNSVNQPITGLVFKWSKAQERIETIQKYQFQLATDALFTTIVANDSTLTDTTKTVNTLNYLTKYYWRVRAQNQTGWGDWSTVWNTTTIIEKPANFTLSAPANNSKGLLNPVTVSWNTSARAEKYILQVSISNTFATFVVNDSTQTDLTEVLPGLNNYTQYYWRVKSINVGGQSDWAEVWNFKTLGNPYASTLYTPANNSVNQPITGLVFKWSKAQERIETVQKYQFQLATDSLFSAIVTNDSTLTDTTKTVNSLSYLTKYYWRVRAQNQTGWGDWSAVWNTTTIIEKPANFTLSAPANNSKGLLNPVTVSWNSSARAEKYILQVSTSSTFNTFVVNDSTQTDLTEVLPTLNNFTEYFWRVKSVNVGGQSDWSATWSFRTLGNPYASTLYTPANNSVNQPITGLVFKWSKAQERIETIQKYQFQLATDSLFSAIVNNDTTFTDTTKTVNSLNYLTKYYWRVRAQNQTGWGDWSAVWKTTTIIELPGIPVLVYPGNNSQNIPLAPVFVWNSSPRSVKYLLQISDTSDFSSIAIQDSAVTDTSKSITGLQQGKVYYWRVKANNAAGWGSFSTVAKFTTLLVAPTQLTAAVVNLRNIQLNWSDNAVNESRYSVERKTGDTASTNAYAVIAENLPPNTVTFIDTSAVYADPSLKFSYRVRAANAAAQSQYSNQSSVQFTIPAPILVSPADNVRELRDTVKLVWRSLQGSVSTSQPGQIFAYHLQVAFDSLFTNLMLNDSTMTDTAKIITLADGNKYYWRVRGKMMVYGEFSPFWRYTSSINTPDSLTAVYDPDQRKVILNWRDKSSSETGFIIERKDSTGNYVFVANAPADAQSYEDAQMSLWSTFMYRIQSYNGYDSSEYIESQSVFTDIRDLAQIPEEYQLSQNYPNPFNPSTVIRFGVPHSSSVEIVLYTLQGQQVMELYRGEVSPGFYELKSDLSRLSSGIYFYRIVARSSESEIFTQTRKLSLIK